MLDGLPEQDLEGALALALDDVRDLLAEELGLPLAPLDDHPALADLGLEPAPSSRSRHVLEVNDRDETSLS